MKLLRQIANHPFTDISPNSDNHFYNSDRKDHFERNLKLAPPDWPWRTKKIKYHLNSQFYRAPEWQDVDWSNSYLIFGCSDTFGVGINYTDTYSHHLSELLGYPTVNLGIPGASCMFQWSNTVTLINNNIKPKGVIYLWPGITRMMTYKEADTAFFHGPWDKQDLDKYWMNNVQHCVEFTKQLVNSVDIMWSCPTFHFHLVREVCKHIPKLKYIKTRHHAINDLARDHYHYIGDAHPGPKSNFDWANQMYNVILKA